MSNFSGATPIGQLRPMQPRTNDPLIMDEIMNDLHEDPKKASDKVVGGFKQNELFEMLKEPIIIALLFLLVTSSFATNLISQHLYTFMEHETLIKAAAIGLLFLAVKTLKLT